MATCADIVGTSLKDNEGEDSFSMLPLFADPESTEFQREATVHSSINGSFAIRKGNYKLVLCPGSGGWSDPKPNAKSIQELPPYQLYDLSKDPAEENNIADQNTETVNALKQELKEYVENGRSTPGAKQLNDPNFDNKPWKQLTVFETK